MTTQADENLTIEEAAAYLGVSVSWLYELRRQGRGPTSWRDPVSVGEPRPSALAREALLTDYASAQVSHVRWTGSTVARRPCAALMLARGTGGTTGTAACAQTRCGRVHIASQRFCVVLSIMGTSGAGLVAQRGSQRPATAIQSSGHCLGPRDMPLVAKRSRHVAVAIPELRVSGVIAVSPCQ
jgi:hypothetical protein